ncbi:flagellar FlbD family protein, partial [Candidatus Latescibacterota bacterium]
IINSDLIEFIEALPDTIVTLTNGQKIIVRESVDEVVERVKAYKRDIYSRPPWERGE